MCVQEASRTAVNLSAGWWNGHGLAHGTAMVVKPCSLVLTHPSLMGIFHTYSHCFKIIFVLFLYIIADLIHRQWMCIEDPGWSRPFFCLHRVHVMLGHVKCYLGNDPDWNHQPWVMFDQEGEWPYVCRQRWFCNAIEIASQWISCDCVKAVCIYIYIYVYISICM